MPRRHYLRMTCNSILELLYEKSSHYHVLLRPVVYICNCNAIRERDARLAIQSGAATAKAVFDHAQCRPQCAKCVCDIRQMIDDCNISLSIAAE